MVNARKYQIALGYISQTDLFVTITQQFMLRIRLPTLLPTQEQFLVMAAQRILKFGMAREPLQQLSILIVEQHGTKELIWVIQIQKLF